MSLIRIVCKLSYINIIPTTKVIKTEVVTKKFSTIFVHIFCQIGRVRKDLKVISNIKVLDYLYLVGLLDDAMYNFFLMQTLVTLLTDAVTM